MIWENTLFKRSRKAESVIQEIEEIWYLQSIICNINMLTCSSSNIAALWKMGIYFLCRDKNDIMLCSNKSCGATWCAYCIFIRVFTNKGGSHRPEKSRKNWIHVHGQGQGPGQGQCRIKVEHAMPQWVLGKKKYPSVSAIYFGKYTPFRVEKYENLNNTMGKFFFIHF